jgi:hypothetical protein
VIHLSISNFDVSVAAGLLLLHLKVYALPVAAGNGILDGH